jgi:hypothetical protein
MMFVKILIKSPPVRFRQKSRNFYRSLDILLPVCNKNSFHLFICSGVVYFADDDNTYDIRLFKEIATTQRISMFPVGFIGSQGMVRPQPAHAIYCNS